MICGQLTASVFVVTRSSRDHHVIIWTNQNPPDVLRLSPCVDGKLIHVDRSDRKMSMPPNLNTGVRDTKTEPATAQLVILPPPYICFHQRESEMPFNTDDIDGLAGDEEELANLVERLDKASTAYGMQISAEKTKLMTNNTSGINTEIKVNGQKLETVTSFRYLGSVITDEGTKPEILSRLSLIHI